MSLRPAPAALALGLSLALLAGCSGETTGPDELGAPPSPAEPAATATTAPASEPVVTEPVEQDLDLAVSTPVEDSVYPDVGDPRVDALSPGRTGLDQHVRLFLTTGILGGFTTFSSFGSETVNMLRESGTLNALANVGANVIVGLLLVWLGRTVAFWIWR